MNRLIRLAGQKCLEAYDSETLPASKRIQSNLGVQGFIDRVEEFSVLALAGTNELKDWRINLNLFTDGKGYHRGFARAYHSVRSEIWWKLFRIDVNSLNISFLKKITRQEEVELLLTGHSYGGALALHAALDLSNHGFNVNLVTFGQPKVLGKVSPQLKLNSYYRVVNPLDPVVYVPFCLKHIQMQKVIKRWWGNTHSMNSYGKIKKSDQIK